MLEWRSGRSWGWVSGVEAGLWKEGWVWLGVAGME